ncbi:MAG: trypsin-like peptidase domain-containing protein [Acidobacteriota bacterium]
MRRTILLSLLIAVSLLLAGPASGQKVNVGEHVAVDMGTSHPYSSSGSLEPVLTTTEQIVHPDATYVAVHFAKMDLAAGDFVIVRSPDFAQQWMYRGQGRHGLGATPDGFFATHIKGDTAIVELWTSGWETAYGYAIDKYGRGFSNTEIADFWAQGLGERMNLPYPVDLARSICTVNDTVEAKCMLGLEPEIYERGRTVARLLQNGAAHCTGWLVGCEGHVMTNEHCIGSQGQLNNIDFEFMAEGPDCATNCQSPLSCSGTTEASGGTLIQVNAPLDYALVLPDTSTANNTDLNAAYGFLQLRESGAVQDERIYIWQHPAGWGKQIAYESSYPGDTNGFPTANLGEPACSGGPPDVGYWADTQGGSSGSPVLAYSDNRVVALHHCRGSAACASGNPGSDDRNRGVPIEDVIADLGANLPNCATCEPPATPGGVNAIAAGADTIDLTWTAPLGDPLSYNVYRAPGTCADPGTFTEIASDVQTTSFTDSTASDDMNWAYYIATFNASEGCESDPTPCVEIGSFTVGVTPSSQSVCVPDDAVFTVDVTDVASFGGSVTLSTSGEPLGASFSANPVVPTASSTLTFDTVVESGIAGTYAIDVTGTAGLLTRGVGIELSVFENTPGVATQTAPADGAVDVAIAPTLSWDAVTEADVYEVQWSTDPAFGSFDNAEVSGTSAQIAGLDIDTTYYWRVRAENPCGDGTFSATRSFTTLDLNILLVDDDDNDPDVRATYTALLDGLGLPYTIQDTNDSDDNEPDSATLAQYTAVIWFSGDSFGTPQGTGPAGPGDAAETALAGWLDNGGCLFISSQDYHYDNGLTTLMTDYLGVASVTDDENQTQATGGGPFAGLGPYKLTYPFSNYSDNMTASADGVVLFEGNDGPIATGQAGQTGFAAAYLAYPLESVDTAGQEEIINAFLTWCSQAQPTMIFTDSFESGDWNNWSSAVVD